MMHYIWVLLIGLIAGAVARFILPGKESMGWVMTMVLGVAGSLVMTYLGQVMGWYKEGAGAGFIASVIGAFILLFVYNRVVAKKV
jgi:uncharacterized membrane protein YeaQ/YmgE (transglycosylase-associated protein family)